MVIVALIGEPATGKTTVARELLKGLSPGVKFKHGLVVGTRHEKEKLIVLGRYEDDSTFCGTDRMSMACQPEVEHFIFEQCSLEKKTGVRWNIFFEGDRLGNMGFFSFCDQVALLNVCCLITPAEEVHARHHQRGDTQKEAFLKSRKTKIRNITHARPTLQLHAHATRADTAAIVEKLTALLL